MNVWDFRRAVRAEAARLVRPDGYCPLGVACWTEGFDDHWSPKPSRASELLELPPLYCQGIALGYDGHASECTQSTPDSHLWRLGLRYGCRWRAIVGARRMRRWPEGTKP
jgi:hypothetical protein